MKLEIIPKLWPFTKRGAPLIFLTILFACIPFTIVNVVPKGLEEGVIYKLLFIMFGFVWLPIALSYCASALLYTREARIYLSSNYNINFYQRSVAFLIGNSICAWLAQKQFDSETAAIAALLLITFTFPIQAIATIVIDLFLLLRRNRKS